MVPPVERSKHSNARRVHDVTVAVRLAGIDGVVAAVANIFAMFASALRDPSIEKVHAEDTNMQWGDFLLTMCVTTMLEAIGDEFVYVSYIPYLHSLSYPGSGATYAEQLHFRCQSVCFQTGPCLVARSARPKKRVFVPAEPNERRATRNLIRFNKERGCYGYYYTPRVSVATRAAMHATQTALLSRHSRFLVGETPHESPRLSRLLFPFGRTLHDTADEFLRLVEAQSLRVKDGCASSEADADARKSTTRRAIRYARTQVERRLHAIQKHQDTVRVFRPVDGPLYPVLPAPAASWV